MNTSRRTVLGAVAAITGATVLTGCIVVPAGDRGGYAGYGGYRSGPVMVAPPPPPGEVIGVAPGPGYFWIGGFWNWIGGRYVWVGGHWEAHRQGYRWQPHHWAREGQGWRAEQGHWERR